MGTSPIWDSSYNWTNNPLYGDHDQYDNRQKIIQGLNLLDGNVPSGGPDDHRDRFNEYGNVFSWDPEANHGKGAWAWSGFLISGHPKPGEPGFDASKDVDWANPKQYGLKNYGDDFYDV